MLVVPGVYHKEQYQNERRGAGGVGNVEGRLALHCTLWILLWPRRWPKCCQMLGGLIGDNMGMF
jgi:hypothetical protein